MKTLESLYQEMYELTNNDCGCDYSKPYRCCEAQYCNIAKKFAKDKYSIELLPINNEMPFMGALGCIVEPHLRPLCTMHACCITYKEGKFPDSNKTKEYFYLRDLILKTAKEQGKYPWD